MDGSKYSDYAFKWYVDHIQKPTDYVILVHCVDFNILGGETDDTVLVGRAEQERKSADAYVMTLAGQLRASKLQGKVKRCAGSARTEILRVAKEENADLIITGTRGMGTVKRTLLGSVSDHVLHHAHVPVIICKMKDDSSHNTHM